jgi:hypothetical protein
MSNIIQAAELITLMSLTFSLALGLEWALLEGIVRAIAAGLQPAASRARRLPVARAERPANLKSEI